MRKSTEGSRRKRKGAIKELAGAAEKRRKNEDRISQLSDDILISIISRLTLREATTTSIISTRWRYLCTYTTHLIFPPFKPKVDISDKYLLQELQEKRFPNYINMVNHILDSHKGGQVKEFRVHMHCLEGATIKRWLEFALARGIEIIEIHMRYFPNARRGHYSLQLSNLIETKPLPVLKCLKELSLSAVHVDDGEVELLLSNFPRLASLCIELSDGLTNVLIVGHSLLLKHLGISYARNLEYVEIGNMMNLVSLRCYGLPSTYLLRIYNVPKLIEFSTSDQVHNTLAEVLPGIPHDQLRLLKLSTIPIFVRTYLPTYMLPKLINLQHLEVEVHMSEYNDDACILFPLIEACPSLEILEIKFLWWEYGIKFKQEEIIVRCPKKKFSSNLKKLKLSGYLGCPSELRFALCMVKNVVALEELIVEPCDVTKRIRRMATVRAREHFRPITPDSVNLVII